MKSILILLSLFVLNINTYCQVFQENIIIDYTFNTEIPVAVHSADIDGDGDMDVLSASFHDNYICWFENIDGQGTFTKANSISENAMGANWVTAFDLDDDGDLDVLSASVLDDKIAWYENIDGQGDFSTEIIISNTMEIASCVYASDLDGDGDMDVIATSILDGKVSWFKNDGDTNFGAEIIISNNTAGATSVIAMDMDGDGDNDVISGSRDDNKVAWFQNDGLGNFSDENIVTTDAQNVESIFASDIDDDGDIDLLSASRLDNKIAWYENDGLGNFSTQILTTTAQEARAVYATDIDGDGDKDVLSASRYTNHLNWYENTDGQGSFGPQQSLVGMVGNALSVFAADIDNDGDMDVLSAENGYDIVWYNNTDGLGSFVKEQVLTRSADRATSVYSADLDGDGDMDVLSSSEEDNRIAWYENIDGDGTFGVQQVVAVAVQQAVSVYAADMDGDNDMDIISASNGQNLIAWYENLNGQGDFGAEQIISSQALNAKQVISVDIDGDNDYDVISASNSDDKIAWYQNDGNGNFGSPLVITTNADGASSVFAADLDGDGDYDILSTSIWDNKVAWYENTDGQGTFGSQQIISNNADGASHVYAADFDGDGDVDVVSSSSDDDKIAWYENLDGLGSFGTEQILSLNANFARSVVAGDIDNDGDLDIISASSSDDKIAWYENLDGLGNFSSELLISNNADDASFVHISDINGNGVMNVLSASIDDDKIAWYKNNDIVSVVEPQNIALHIFPNPSKDYINISSTNSIQKIEIFTSLGKPILLIDYQQVINISNLAKGVYFCVITDSTNQRITRKIIRH